MSLLQDYIRVKPNKQSVQALVNECIDKLANSFQLRLLNTYFL